MMDAASSPVLSTKETVAQPIGDGQLDARLFRVVAVILTVVFILMFASLTFQIVNYSRGIESALGQTDPNHTAVILYARSLDVAVVKSSGVFLGFLLVFTGALYVLRQSTAGYALEVKTGSVQGNLQSSSPGLIMVTLGVALIVTVILAKKELDFTTSESPSAAITQDNSSSINPTVPSHAFEPPPKN